MVIIQDTVELILGMAVLTRDMLAGMPHLMVRSMLACAQAQLRSLDTVAVDSTVEASLQLAIWVAASPAAMLVDSAVGTAAAADTANRFGI